jgi:hypothetical protein
MHAQREGWRDERRLRMKVSRPRRAEVAIFGIIHHRDDAADRRARSSLPRGARAIGFEVKGGFL